MEKRDGQSIGSVATTAATTIIGGFLLWAVLNPFATDKETNSRRDNNDDRTREQISEIREEYRGEIASLRADVEAIKSRTKDSFSSSDFEREDRRIAVELRQIRNDLGRIETRLDRVTRYLAEGGLHEGD